MKTEGLPNLRLWQGSTVTQQTFIECLLPAKHCANEQTTERSKSGCLPSSNSWSPKSSKTTFLMNLTIYQNKRSAPVGWLSRFECCPIQQKVQGFDHRSGNIPRFWVRPPVRSCMGSNRWMFLTSVFLSLSLSLSFNPFLSNCLRSINISSDKD